MQMSERERVYLDNAAATPLDARVFEVMRPLFLGATGNAGAIHAEGVIARTAVESARTTVARTLHALADEVIFTSGGTESNNIAIMGSVHAQVAQGRDPSGLHIITTAIEHSSVLGCMSALAQQGVHVTYLPVDADGRVAPAVLAEALTPQTVLVSAILAHNEIGTVQPIRDLVRAVRRYASEQNLSRIIVHTDASQAPAWFACRVDALDVDLLTLDAHKAYGPKGVGCLYRRRGTPLAPILYGGAQEQGVRSGTAPTPLIVGCARAFELADAERELFIDHVRMLRDRMISEIRTQVPHAVLNGPTGDERLANNVNLSFPGLDGEAIVVALDARGIAVSTRSACLHDDEPGSYTIRALGKGDAIATSAVRLSLSRYTTEEECVYAITQLVDVVHWLYGTKDANEDERRVVGTR